MNKKLKDLMRSRQELGLKEYGVPVTPDAINPRHLTEEVLDALVYAKALELKERGKECDDVWQLLIDNCERGHDPDCMEEVLPILFGVLEFLVKYEDTEQ